MKPKIVITLLVLLVAGSRNIPAFASQNQKSNNKLKKIELKEKVQSFRSATATQVKAFTNGETLTVEIDNYTGSVQVQVFGACGTRQVSFSCDQIGYGELNIASLPAAIYTVAVMLNGKTYTGTFVK